MSKDILSVENITMQFGGVVAVNNLSLHIPEGQIVALIGPNGAGKTTAFNCITGVYEPTNGLVKFLDEPMVRNHPSGKMKKLYKGENPLLYTAEYHPEDETKEQMLARDPLAGTGKIVSPTPDKITKLGIARTFQNIRLWKSMTARGAGAGEIQGRYRDEPALRHPAPAGDRPRAGDGSETAAAR